MARLFKSNLDIDPDTRIISLSDIHGDMDALIIALRDCARVIRPRSGIPNPGDNRRDPELVRLLNLDLTNLSEMQEFDANCDLGFDWIGDTAHVVLIGDTIDPVRKNALGKLETPKLSKTKGRNVNDVYPQAEIKILKFLNRLDVLAETHSGSVIKLIGNHEIANFYPAHSYGNLYTHDGNENMPYLNKGVIKFLPRNQYFNLNNPGFKLFMERGSGIFLIINNTIFVHGQVYNTSKPNFTYKYCSDFNDWINSSTPLSDSWPHFGIFVNSSSQSSAPQLWDRDYGDDQLINKRLPSQHLSTQFCDSVKTNIASFLVNHPHKSRFDPDNTRVVIGHCPQMYSSWYLETNRTFITKTNVDNVVELTKPAETFQNTVDKIDDNNVFGISMECPQTTKPDQDHKIYRVDIGTSRGFDTTVLYNNVNNHTDMKRYFLSRVPQVLQFQADDVRIIRSTLKNSRIHQERTDFEDMINTRIGLPIGDPTKLPQDMGIGSIAYGGYKEKYLKYKLKYLELKKNLN